MKKMLKPWAETGSKSEFTDPGGHDAKIANGWVANDQPSAENVNYIDNERDLAINESGKQCMTALGGVNPDLMDGLDSTRKVPTMRANPHIGNDAVAMPWSPRNLVYSPSNVVIHDCAVGWDPSIHRPILVLSHGTSMVGNAASASLTILPCWVNDFDAAADTPEERVINFTKTELDHSTEFPVLVCDGYLYVIVSDTSSYNNRTVYRYDLLNWTGNPDASLSLGTGSSYGPNAVSEMVELNDTQIGVLVRHFSFSQARLHVIEKDLSSRTPSSPVLGVANMRGFCRTDGEYVFGAGIDTTFAYPYIWRFKISDGTFTTYNPSGYANDRIVDIYPITTSTDLVNRGSALCYVHNTGGSTAPRIRFLGRQDPTWQFDSNYYSLVSGEANLAASSVPGSFCAIGASLFVTFTANNGGGNFGGYLRIDPATAYPPIVANRAFYPARNVVGVASPNQFWTYSDSILRTKTLFDGRDMWVVDMHGGVGYRVVAPLTRHY